MDISIHAPRTGSDDVGEWVFTIKHDDFNPRSPHGERLANDGTIATATAFQSTLPARGATEANNYHVLGVRISIHAPRTGSDINIFHIASQLKISIHAPRTGSDSEASRYNGKLPMISIHAPRTGSDSEASRYNGKLPMISIHAPRTGSDPPIPRGRSNYGDFNPRSPHGERLRNGKKPCHTHNFNPRSPHGERPVLSGRVPVLIYFNPRSPHGERLLFRALRRAHIVISIHAPRTGSDPKGGDHDRPGP